MGMQRSIYNASRTESLQSNVSARVTELYWTGARRQTKETKVHVRTIIKEQFTRQVKNTNISIVQPTTILSFIFFHTFLNVFYCLFQITSTKSFAHDRRRCIYELNEPSSIVSVPQIAPKILAKKKEIRKKNKERKSKMKKKDYSVFVREFIARIIKRKKTETG